MDGEALPKSNKMNNALNNTRNSFEDFLKSNLSLNDFNTLPEQLGFSQRRVTMRVRNPKEMEAKMIEKLVPILNKNVSDPLSIKEWMDKFELGYDMVTVREYRKLTGTK